MDPERSSAAQKAREGSPRARENSGAIVAIAKHWPGFQNGDGRVSGIAMN